MSEVVLEKPEGQTEEQELAEVMAGYSKARGEEPPAEVAAKTAQEEPVKTGEVAADEAATEAITEPTQPDPEPTVATLAEELKALRAKVASTEGDPAAVRKLHGEIGNINRTLKALQTPARAEDAPANDELAAALKDAEAAASEFPESAGPLVKALKVLMARQTPAQAEPVDIDERVSTAVSKVLEKTAIESLREEHPDYETVRETPEYKAWLASKTPEFQERFNTTWNSAVVSRGLTEFKDSLKAKERKQTRLAAAVTPQGIPQKATPSAISDEDALLRGYNSGPKRRLLKR